MSETANSRQTHIITFKPKDQRADTRSDKQELVRSALATDLQFLAADDVSRQGRAVASAQDMELVGYDVNRYEAPILMAHLTDDEAQEVAGHQDVLRVEQDQPMHALDLQREDQPDPLAQTIPAGITQIHAPEAWQSSQGKGIKVFICDTGIQSDHPDLKANLHEGRSFVPTESTTEDFHGHGTHCAGTVAATFNDIGVVGVAPYAYLHPVKVLSGSGSGSFSWLIAALDWIATKKGARIASMSLGGASAPQALGDMCKAVYEKGVLLVAAAGNSGPGNDTVGYPAKYPHVVAVSAVDGNDVIANFSSRGPEVEVAAPGVQVLSTIRNSGYGRMSGTSMACPHVAGVAALAWGSHRGATNKQIRWLLNAYAERVGNGDRNLYGSGRVNANNSAFHIGQPPEWQL